MNYIYPILWVALVVAALSTELSPLNFLLWIAAIGICIAFGLDNVKEQSIK